MAKREPEGLDDISENLKPFKKPLHAIAAFVGAGGLLIALILVFMVNDTLNKLESSTIANLDAAQLMLEDIEVTLVTAETEVDSMEGNLETIKVSVSHLAEGVKGSGETMGAMGQELSVLSILGSDFSQYSEGLNQSGEDLIESSRSLTEVGDSVTGHGGGLMELKTGISEIRGDISSQKAQIGALKTSMQDAFGTMKLANILLFFLIAVMLAVPMLNAMAGII